MEPTPVEAIKLLLTEHPHEPEGRRARHLVLEARRVLDEHLREAWACGAVVARGESTIRTVCGCRYCEELTPIAEIDLPVEQIDPATREQPDRGVLVAVAKVKAEDLYRTTNDLAETQAIVSRAFRTRRNAENSDADVRRNRIQRLLALAERDLVGPNGEQYAAGRRHAPWRYQR